MNHSLFRYKLRFITLALLIGYAYLHVKLTGSYFDATPEKLIDFSARLPFGQRLLIPAIAHVTQLFFPLDATSIFFVLELLFAGLLYLALFHLLLHKFCSPKALLLTWLFFLILPLVSVVNYRLTIGEKATFFYPYDTPTLFFLALGFLWCLQRRWPLIIALVFLATFNRESAFLIVLMIPALYWQNIRKILKPFTFVFLAWLSARLIVLFLIAEQPGPHLEWFFRQSSYTHFEVNLVWLLEDQNFLLFIFGMAGLPFFWFAFYDYIPKQYQPLRYVAFAYFLGLLMVGNFMETRIFGEIVVLLYFPVCISLSRWLQGWQPQETKKENLIFFIDRYFILATLTLIVLARSFLNSGVISLSAIFK